MVARNRRGLATLRKTWNDVWIACARVVHSHGIYVSVWSHAIELVSAEEHDPYDRVPTGFGEQWKSLRPNETFNDPIDALDPMRILKLSLQHVVEQLPL